MFLFAWIVAVAATIGWLALDIIVSLTTPMPLSAYHTLLIGGVVLGAITLFSEILVFVFDSRRRLQEQIERQQLERKIETAAASHSGKLEMLGMFQALQVRRPVEITPEAKVIPNDRLTNAQKEIEDLRQRLHAELARWPVVLTHEIDAFIHEVAFLNTRHLRVYLTCIDQSRDISLFSDTITDAFRRAGVTIDETYSTELLNKLLTRRRNGEFTDNDLAGLQIYSSLASGYFADELQNAFEIFPQGWGEPTVVRDNEIAPPDDLIVITIGYRWPSAAREARNAQDQ